MPCDAAQSTGIHLPAEISCTAKGVFHWQYDLNLYKNLSILGLLIKIFFFIAFGIGLFLLVIELFDGLPSWKTCMAIIQTALLLCVLLTGLTLIGYLLYALIMGGCYKMEFIMNDESIIHRQRSDQFSRVQKIAWIVTVLGCLARRPGTAGTGLLAGSRSSMTTRFNSIRQIKTEPDKLCIHLLESVKRNRIYVPQAAYGFVLDFIRNHAPQASFVEPADKVRK